VLSGQIPALAEFGDAVRLVTLLAGANDMFPRARRPTAVWAMSDLLDVPPAGRSVVATLPRRNPQALAINALLDDAAARGDITIADMRGLTVRSLIGTRAEDCFHPDERGYAHIAEVFGRAIQARAWDLAG
jgi:lysophospholipase L1-like esterase